MTKTPALDLSPLAASVARRLHDGARISAATLPAAVVDDLLRSCLAARNAAGELVALTPTPIELLNYRQERARQARDADDRTGFRENLAVAAFWSRPLAPRPAGRWSVAPKRRHRTG